jgi:long-subunit fatty acid transport protein
MNNKIVWFFVSAIVALVAAAALGFREHAALDASRAQLVVAELQPMAALLQENGAIMNELGSERFKENDSGILESYLVKVRRDGVPKHADMKQRLDTLAENNTAIVTLIKAYAPHAKTGTFTVEADKFRNYASAWRDRWNSVMELFMAGGNYAVSETPFPLGLPPAVQAEIAAAK